MENSFRPISDRIPTTLSTLTTGESCSLVSTFSEKGDQECPGHDFLMSRYAVRYVSSKSEA